MCTFKTWKKSGKPGKNEKKKQMATLGIVTITIQIQQHFTFADL